MTNPISTPTINIHTPATNGHSTPLAGGAVPNFGEAPASLTLKISYRGYTDILFTLRDTSGAGLLGKLDAALNKFEKMGITPGGSARGNGHAAPAANGDAPLCPDGHGPMKASQKHGGWYCTKVIAESAGKKVYCKQKVEA
jgi:hypothetical protein